MAPRKHQRQYQESPAATEPELPADLMLEIVARSDLATLVRCAAICKSFRRDILRPSFISHVAKQAGIAPNILAYLHTCPVRDQGHLVSLVHPATPATTQFIDGRLAPYLLHHPISLLQRYNPMTSRGGLVLLRRRHRGVKWCESSENCLDLCVYNPMDGVCAYLSDPPDFHLNSCDHTYVLLTAADDIACSFQLMSANVGHNKNNGGRHITLRMAKPSGANGATWGPLISYGPLYGSLQSGRDAVVLQDGIIYWLLSGVERILTYNIYTKRMARVKLPPINHVEGQRILVASIDGRLQLLTAEKFMLSIWVKLPDGQVHEEVIDSELKLRSLNPTISPDCMSIEFMRSGERTGVVLFTVYHDYMWAHVGPLVVLDLETKEMRKQDWHPAILFEVDLSTRLRSVKIFP